MQHKKLPDSRIDRARREDGRRLGVARERRIAGAEVLLCVNLARDARASRRAPVGCATRMRFAHRPGVTLGVPPGVPPVYAPHVFA
ncbi:hypothetical protein C0Z17_14800 [Trinickia caryophylli]|nr:hypothetical protein C0Z17_14800 [Trinickia caryophylli]